MWDTSLSGSLQAYEVTRFAGGHKVARPPAGRFWQCSQFADCIERNDVLRVDSRLSSKVITNTLCANELMTDV